MKHHAPAETNDRATPAIVRFALQADPTLPPRTFRGMASVFGTLIDTWTPTRILPGAFAVTLADADQRRRVKVCWQHDTMCPIGRPTRMEETPDGLLVEAQISDTEQGRDALTLMRDGVVDELSIGFDPIKWETVDENGNQVRYLRELKLWEFSPVTFGANSAAKITAVHALLGGLPDGTSAWLGPMLERLSGADAMDPVACLRHDLLPAIDRHVGKVLSAKHREKVDVCKNDIDAVAESLRAVSARLQELLDAADGVDDSQALIARVQREIRALECACLVAGVIV